MAAFLSAPTTAGVFEQPATVLVAQREPCDLRSGKDSLLSKLSNTGDGIEINDALAIIRPHHRYPYAVVVLMMRDGTIDAMFPSATEDQVILRRT